MNTVRLTKRGKAVVALAIAAFAIAVVGMLMNATTPDECKVALERMSEGCKSLIYG